MKATSRLIIVIAMMIFTAVSMWTTYMSLSESILPKPTINIAMGADTVWECSVLALAMSVAIGLMLFALKIAIIDEHKRLNPLGVAGMTVVAFISISFNIDVLYRFMEEDFMIQHSEDEMRGAYETFMVEAQSELLERREEAMKLIARQEGELEAEIRGLREAPAGYGPRARAEEHELTLLSKQAEVDLTTADAALAAQQEADTLLTTSMPRSVDEIQELQNKLRVQLTDVAAVSGVPMPQPVSTENPLFAVFDRIFDLSQFGVKEGFIIAIAFLLDLGDIIGYSMVPNQKRKKDKDGEKVKTVGGRRTLDDDPIAASLPTSLPALDRVDNPFELAPIDPDRD